MVVLRQVKKISVLVICGLFLGAGLLPIMNGAQTTENKTHEITMDIATRVATAKLQELNKRDISITEKTQITNEEGEPLFYVFNLNPPGYLIITGSYDLPPVIAYSFTSNFQANAKDGPLFDLLYADLTLRLKYIQYIPGRTLEERHLQWDTYSKGIPLSNGRFEQWPPEGSTPTGGWLLTNWHQNAPYNNFCPLDLANGGARSAAGCPAVTIAQILNYHNTTMNVVFNDSDDYYHNYGGNQFWIDNNYVTYGFKSFPQLNTYLFTLQSHYESQTPPTNDDKAAITFACGVAATQVYGASGSGTFGVNQAYEAYQRFNCTTISLLDEDDPDLYNRLSSNMKDALPAHLAVVNEGWTVGHNLVVDGYNTDNYFHVNFGWGGSYNGWYLIPEELPYDLTVIEGVIVDILKNTAVPDLSCEGTLEWNNVTPNETVTSSFTVSNIGEDGSNLDWNITEWPSWGEWAFTPSSGNNQQPDDGPTAVTVNVVVPDQENHLFTGEVKIENLENSSDYSTISVSLQTGYKIHEKLFCNGSLTWSDVKPKSTITGSFTIENVGAAFTNLSWEVTEWPDWGTWTLTPSEGDHLTPEDGPVTINVSVVAPLKRNIEFSGQIKIVNSENSSDFDTIPVTLATPYQFHLTILDILQTLLERYPHAFPLLRLLINS
ncbi:MAG TPA: C10 family peptidase [Candidatus Thermoplasmatota archaeon]|nr:C10 family peptidase [Candidatus Thermoplasmatota archaeon]